MTPQTEPRQPGAAPPVNAEWFHWLPDWCPSCVQTVAHRPDALIDASSLTWRGGPRFTTSHECECCGERWTAVWPIVFLFGPDEPL